MARWVGAPHNIGGRKVVLVPPRHHLEGIQVRTVESWRVIRQSVPHQNYQRVVERIFLLVVPMTTQKRKKRGAK